MLFVLRATDGNDPASDLATLEYELVLADLASVEQRLGKQKRLAKGDKTLGPEIAALERAIEVLGDGTPVYRSDLSADERTLLGPVFLLTNKPVLSVVNIGVEQLDEADAIAKQLGDDALAVCLELEGDPDVVAAQGAERAELLADLGVPESVVPRLARSAYQLLGLRTFLTTGDKESRAWTFRAGAAPECAGRDPLGPRARLHPGRGDPLGRAPRARLVGKAKEQHKLRVEGKEYVVADGDVLEIRFNV